MQVSSGQAGSKWLDFGGSEGKPTWLEYDLLVPTGPSPPLPATRYMLTSANDFPERDPADFRLEGLPWTCPVSPLHSAKPAIIPQHPATDSLDSNTEPQSTSAVNSKAQPAGQALPDHAPTHTNSEASQNKTASHPDTTPGSDAADAAHQKEHPGFTDKAQPAGSNRRLGPKDDPVVASPNHSNLSGGIMLSNDSAPAVQTPLTHDDAGKNGEAGHAGDVSNKVACLEPTDHADDVEIEDQNLGTVDVHEQQESAGVADRHHKGHSWVVLDEQTNICFANRHQQLTFQINAPRACR